MSYGYNGLGGTSNDPPTLPDQTTFPGLFGWKLSAIHDSARTVLIDDYSAARPFFWHEHKLLPDGQTRINNSRNTIGFADVMSPTSRFIGIATLVLQPVTTTRRRDTITSGAQIKWNELMKIVAKKLHRVRRCLAYMSFPEGLNKLDLAPGFQRRRHHFLNSRNRRIRRQAAVD